MGGALGEGRKAGEGGEHCMPVAQELCRWSCIWQICSCVVFVMLLVKFIFCLVFVGSRTYTARVCFSFQAQTSYICMLTCVDDVPTWMWVVISCVCFFPTGRLSGCSW